jgi:hypothetical protein
MRRLLLGLVLSLVWTSAWAQPSPTALLDCTTASNCGSSTPGTSFLTPSFTAHSGRLVLFGVGCTDPNDNVPTAPTVASAHGTWTNIGVTNTSDAGVSTWIFRTVPSGDQTGQVTITSGSGSLDECAWFPVEWTGADVSSGGANAIVQSKGSSASTGTTVTATLVSAYASANNRPWAWAHAVNGVFSFSTEAGWTALPASSSRSSGTSAGAWRNDTADTSYTATFGTNHYLSLAIVEIKADAGCAGARLSLTGVGC